MHPLEVEMTANARVAARSEGVERFVYCSVLHPLLRDVRHHRLKLDCEERLADSNLAWTIVQASRYMQHLLPIRPQVLKDGVHRMPFRTRARFSLVDLNDVAAAVALVVGDQRRLYASHELAGPEPLSQEDMAAITARVLGRPIPAEGLPLESMARDAPAKGLNADRMEQMRTMSAH
jgi:uncharacterized protein YbjT (DUF2867 family)